MDIFQILASMASIISIPLAIYFARKNNSTTSEKARLDIIKTLSYRLSDTTHTLTHEDIDSVYKSKLREHEIIHAKFNKEDILNDLKTDVMSNAFLDNKIKNEILYNLSTINFPKKSIIDHPTNKLFLPFIRAFISPVPYIFLVASIIICVIFLCPYIFEIIAFYILNNRISIDFMHSILFDLYNDMLLHISLIFVLILSTICFFRKKYLKKL